MMYPRPFPPSLRRRALRGVWRALAVLLACCAVLPPAQAQDDGYDPSWYEPSRTYVKVAVTSDGVYSFSGEDLSRLGVSPSDIDPATLQLYENGREIPIWYAGATNRIDNDARIYFVGKRNQGTEESWAYRDRPDWQSSTYYSLYTDTTFYWLAWGRALGLRYRLATSSQQPLPDVFTYRDTLHLESELGYYDGDGDDAENPFFTRGEGTYGRAFAHTNTDPFARVEGASLSNLARADNREDSVYVQVRLNSITATRHRVGLELQTTVGGETAYRAFDEADWTGYAFRTLRAVLPEGEVPTAGGNALSARLTSYNEFNAQPNISLIDWIEISYVRELAARNGALRFTLEGNGLRRIHLKGFGADSVLVLNPHDRRLYVLRPTGGAASFTDQPAASVVYWAASAGAVVAPAALSVDRSSNWASTSNEADYVILTPRALRASAEALAAYRRARSGFRVAVVDVQDVYDQFDYGRPTPLAIRRFARQTQTWRTKARFLTLWGDAYYASRTRPRPAWEVPSYGKASADGWFAMQAGGPEDWSEFLAVGRLPVRDNETGLLFLQKLQSYESAPLDVWQKRMLVLVGGRGENEQQLLQNLVEPWSARATAAPAGMDTLNFHRSSENALDFSFQDTLRLAMRQGASWLSYFGHSAASTWEIVVDDPDKYDNAARLPLALSLGCRTGAFAGGANQAADFPVLAEKLVIGSLNGAIGHWGTSGLGSVSASARLGDQVHRLVFSDTLRTIGSIFQEAKRSYVASGNFNLKDLAQFGYIGDPATRLDIPTRPDFHLAQESVRITPVAPIPADSQLSVTITLENRGLVPADSITLRMTHLAPDGGATLYTVRLAPFRLREQTVFTVPISEETVGENTFRVEVDPENAYQEVLETNNTAERTQVVFSSQLTLVAPRNLGVVSGTPVRFRVTFTAKDDQPTPIIFELDEVPTFDSPNRRTFNTVAQGVFAVWSVDDPLEPGRIYYWRARTDAPGDPLNWQQAAFVVAEGASRDTWAQTGVLFDLNTQNDSLAWNRGRWELGTYQLEVQATSERGGGQFKGRFLVDGVQIERNDLGFGMLILDGTKGAVRGHGSMPTYQNQFEDPVAAQAELEALVAQIREGDYVYVRTRHLANRGTPEIAEDIKAIFRALGSTAIDTLTYDDLWIMRTRAGHPEETLERVDLFGGTNEIIHEEVLTFSLPRGKTRSPLIGPARSWSALDWQAELPNTDSEVRVDVLDATGEQVLLGGLTTAPADLSFLDARRHPFLRLQATLADTSQRATPQLKRWSIDYGTIPEVVLDASSITLSADTLQESEQLTVSASVYNISDAKADTVLLSLHLTDAANRTTLVAIDTLRSLGADSVATRSFTLNTEGLLGQNLLTFKAEQSGLKELLTFNNTAITGFRVRGDRAAPTLAVTIDGKALPNDPEPVRDLQSPDIPQLPLRPTIEIVLADENPFKLLTDTSLVVVTLNKRRVAFSRPDVLFEPATAQRNEARLVFTPDFTGQDSVYTLGVSAFDVSGNEAEGSPYQTHFKVQSTFKIGSVYPYPNPMSSFTRFAFLVQGSDPSVIEDLRIRIYTLSGRVVQEFDLIEDPSGLEDGALRIGWNKLIWDGRDVDGDLLAPGVYLYKVYVKAEGQAIRVNNDSGIEKLAIIR